MDDGWMIHAVAVLVDGQAQAAADFLAAEIVLSLCLSAQMTNTFGLSQPSRRAECEKMKRTGSAATAGAPCSSG
jgi:hypothetical protein